MINYQQVFENNRRWAREKKAADSAFFEKLAKDQQPGFLFIGCSDSRVPPEVITGAGLGEMLVHRNVANLVDPSDPNAMSVIHFAVESLKVAHIVVCGHYNCVGINTAMENGPDDAVRSWLRPVRVMAGDHRDELENIADLDGRFRRLVELNVETQCRNILALPVVREGIAKSNFPSIHAWVYDMNTGGLNDLDFRY